MRWHRVHRSTTLSQARIVVIALLMILSGCTSVGSSDLSSRLLGTWQTRLGDFSVTTAYTAEDVTVEGQSPQAFRLEEDLLIINDDLTTARRISFESRSEMLQTDVVTGTVHRYTRLP